eukprot:1352383-Rhodomonas_salina.2
MLPTCFVRRLARPCRRSGAVCALRERANVQCALICTASSTKRRGFGWRCLVPPSPRSIAMLGGCSYRPTQLLPYLRHSYEKSGTEVVYGATRVLDQLIYKVSICLRSAACGTAIAYSGACCAESGTAIAYGGICLRVHYAMSGTDIAYGAISGPTRGES